MATPKGSSLLPIHTILVVENVQIWQMFMDVYILVSQLFFGSPCTIKPIIQLESDAYKHDDHTFLHTVYLAQYTY